MRQMVNVFTVIWNICFVTIAISFDSMPWAVVQSAFFGASVVILLTDKA
jgi:hypothetical protein